MSSFALLLLVVAAVLTLCVLLVLFMLAIDRDSEQPGWFKRLRSFTASFGFGILLLVWAGFCWRIAFEAELRHTLIHATYETGWMSPQQGYLAAFLIFLLAGYSIYLAVRDRRNRPRNGTRSP